MAPDTLQFPTVAAPIIMAYHLPGSNKTQPLILSGDILAKIYLGQVRNKFIYKGSDLQSKE